MRWERQLLLVAAVTAIVPIYLLLISPPFLNYVDACVMFQSTISYNFPHWKPLYIVFVRGVNGLASATGFGEIFEIVPVKMLSLYIIVIIQHICTMSAVLLFSWTVARTIAGRLLTAILLSVYPITFLSAHFIALEGFLPALLLALVALVLRVSSEDGCTKRNLALLAGFLFLAANIRHDLIILLSFAPLAVLAGALVRKDALAQAMRRFALVLGVSAAILVSTVALEKGLLRVLDIEVDSIAGRLGLASINAEEYPRMNEAEQAAFASAMVGCLASVPGADGFVQIVMHPQGDAYMDVQRRLVQQNPILSYLKKRQRNDHTDMLLNKLLWCYLQTNPSRFWTQGMHRVAAFKDVLIRQQFFVDASTGFLRVAKNYPVMSGVADETVAFRDGRGYQGLIGSPLYSVFNSVTVLWLGVAAVAASLLGVAVHGRHLAGLPTLFPALLVGAGHLALAGFIAGPVLRYGIVFCVLYYASLLLVGIGALERATDRRRAR